MQKTKAETEEWHPNQLAPLSCHTHFLACLVTMLRGGVTGRLPLGFFFSAGFKIYKKRVGNVSQHVVASLNTPNEKFSFRPTVSDPMKFFCGGCLFSINWFYSWFNLNAKDDFLTLVVSAVTQLSKNKLNRKLYQQVEYIRHTETAESPVVSTTQNIEKYVAKLWFSLLLQNLMLL